jgi:hypothetical protein
MARRKYWESWEGRRQPVDDVVVPRYETGFPVCGRDLGPDSLHWCLAVPLPKMGWHKSLDNVRANFNALITVICRLLF